VTGTPVGFNASEVRAGIHLAMQFGESPLPAKRVVFYVPLLSVMLPPAYPVDSDGVPFNPVTPFVPKPYDEITVLCAVEYLPAERDPVIDQAGSGVHRSRVLITLLDTEFDLVHDADFITIDGDKYLRDWEAPPIGLGPIGVYQVRFTAEDEA
jgi:hypothetical protein